MLFQRSTILDSPTPVFRLFQCLAVLTVAAASAIAHDAASSKPASDGFFGNNQKWDIHIHVTADAWKKMEPIQTMPAFGMGPPLGANAASPSFRPGRFGYEFQYVRADVVIGEERYSDVGLRFKGNGTYMMSTGMMARNQYSRPFKIDFDRYNEKQSCYGLKKINLHNDVMDPTHARQAVAYSTFSKGEIPTPRTTFALVYLSIDGQIERELLGVYTVVEEIDKAFLKSHYKNSKGMLLKPEGPQGIEYLGETWDAYEWYGPKSPPSPEQSSRFIEFARLIHQSDDTSFRQSIETMLDIDSFSRYLAINVLLSNMDSFLTNIHNYWIYLRPDDNRFEFLPWDMDLAFGAFPFAGSNEQLADLSIRHPHMGSNKLIERLMEWNRFRELYEDKLRIYNTNWLKPNGSIQQEWNSVRLFVESIAVDLPKLPSNTPPFSAGMFGTKSLTTEEFIEKRYRSIDSQLRGESNGYIPVSFFPGAPVVGPGASQSRNIDFGGPNINEPQSFSPDGNPVSRSKWETTPPFPMENFGPGNFHAPSILREADQNKDGYVSRSEMIGLIERWFDFWDSDRNGFVSQTELIDGLNQSLAPISPIPNSIGN